MAVRGPAAVLTDRAKAPFFADERDRYQRIRAVPG
jgi:hypothetical protein